MGVHSAPETWHLLSISQTMHNVKSNKVITNEQG